MKKILFLFFSQFLILSSCQFFEFSSSDVYDRNNLTLQTVSLFNQVKRSRFGKKSWSGDWVYRRSRLALIDKELERVQPDILVFQNVMQKWGSSRDSDLAILSAGSLAGYRWKSLKVQEYPETQETESLAIGVTSYLDFAMKNESESIRELDGAGHLSQFKIMSGGEPILVFNLALNRKVQCSATFARISNLIDSELRRKGTCYNRFVLAGFFNGCQSESDYGIFRDRLELKDVTDGMCDDASVCHTLSSENSLLNATEGDTDPIHADRILVHDSTVVSGGGRNFLESQPDSHALFKDEYGMEQIWATHRYGWHVNLRFERCARRDLEVQGPA